MKKIYIRPMVSVVSMGNNLELLAGVSGDTPNATGYNVGGGSDGGSHLEDGPMGSGVSSEFDGGPGAKRNNSWSPWGD